MIHNQYSSQRCRGGIDPRDPPATPARPRLAGKTHEPGQEGGGVGACSVPQTPSRDSSEAKRVHWQRKRAVTRVWGPWERCGCSRAGSGRQQSEASRGTMRAPLGTCARQSGQALTQHARSASAARDHPQAHQAGGGRQGSPTKGAAWGQLHRERPSQGARAVGDSSPGLTCWEEGRAPWGRATPAWEPAWEPAGPGTVES